MIIESMVMPCTYQMWEQLRVHGQTSRGLMPHISSRLKFYLASELSGVNGQNHKVPRNLWNETRSTIKSHHHCELYAQYVAIYWVFFY